MPSVERIQFCNNRRREHHNGDAHFRLCCSLSLCVAHVLRCVAQDAYDGAATAVQDTVDAAQAQANAAADAAQAQAQEAADAAQAQADAAADAVGRL